MTDQTGNGKTDGKPAMTGSWFSKERFERKARKTVPECLSAQKTSGHSPLCAARSWKTSARPGAIPTGASTCELFHTVINPDAEKRRIGIIPAFPQRANRAVAL